MKGSTFLTGLGLGLGAMYLLDPAAGRRRRALIRDKAMSASNTTRDVSEKTWRDLRNRSEGLAARVRSVGQGRQRSTPDVLQENWAPATRFLVGAGGSALVTWAAARRDAMSSALGLVGVGLLARSVTNRRLADVLGRGGRDAVSFGKTIRIEAPVEDVYQFFANPENFPRFMSHLTEVTRLDEGRHRWRATGPGGTEVEWVSVIGEQRPNRLISWHSVEGSSLPNRGSVRFTPSDGGTRVDIRMGYTPPGGQLGHAVAVVFGDDPKTAMDEDLNRLKTLLESGSTSIGGRDVADNLGTQGEAGPWS